MTSPQPISSNVAQQPLQTLKPLAPLHLLSGGAAQGLVTQLQDRFQGAYPYSVKGTYGAVGMMKDSLLSGAPCDVLILTKALIAQLVASGDLVAGSEESVGTVKTGVATKSGEKAPDTSNPAALKASLQAARGIYIPDPIKSTAGIHFMNVLQQLGLDTELADRLRPFPNGAAAMKAMAQTNEPGMLGCTQITEILNTEGITLIAPLPQEFELATVYTAAICTRSDKPEAARALIAMLVSADTAALRLACGFEP